MKNGNESASVPSKSKMNNVYFMIWVKYYRKTAGDTPNLVVSNLTCLTIS